MADIHKFKNCQLPVGEILFKFMMQKSVIDTRATSTVMRNNLSSFDNYISTVKSDASKFNQYMKLNLIGLQSRGENSGDLMSKLFKFYLVTSYM